MNSAPSVFLIPLHTLQREITMIFVKSTFQALLAVLLLPEFLKHPFFSSAVYVFFNASVIFAPCDCIIHCEWGHPFIIPYVVPEDGQISKPASCKRDSGRQGSSFGSHCRHFQQASSVAYFLFHRTQGKRWIANEITIVIKLSLLLIALLWSVSEHRCTTLWHQCLEKRWLLEFPVVSLKAVIFYPDPESSKKSKISVGFVCHLMNWKQCCPVQWI